ncbi:phage tail length tape measure family protein [Comamonas thiooxydans]|uniref:phage tail length tape measure family protein n=1 Tax=Comamonas thiooxydans TaxID=363952 RepID=UPI0005F82800|nr:phage tail length tape measure family protein [Comamonas thiooxydans]CUA97902.1 Prophage tail length tape measure protein [Comamonas thiooxydans]
MSALGSLVVKLALEYAQFTQGLDKNEQAALKNAKNVQDAYDKMAGAVEDRYKSVKESIANTVGGIISVAGLLAAAAKVREETINAEKEQAQLAAALKSTGEAAGWSQDRLNDMADAMEKATTYSAGEVNQAQARLLAYVNITGEQVPRAIRAAMDMGTRLEMNLNQSMETVAKALDKPSTGMQSLQRQGFKFTESQIEMAKALENSGRLADAQAIVFAELESSYGGAAEAARDTLGGALTAVGNTINSLMTADSASLPALRQSVEDLNTTLQSEGTRAAFQTFTGWVVGVGGAAVRAAANLVTFLNIVRNADPQAKANQSANTLQARSRYLLSQADLFTQLSEAEPSNENYKRHLAAVRSELNQVSASMTATSEQLKGLSGSTNTLAQETKGATQETAKQATVVGLTDTYLKKYGSSAQKAAIEIAEWKSKLGAAFTPEMEAKIREAYAKQDAGARGAAQSVKQLQTAYDNMAKGLDEKIASQRLELATSEKLTDSAKLRIKYEQELKGSLAGLSQVQRDSLDTRLKTLAALEEEIEAQQKLAKLAEEERAYRQQWWGDQAKTVEELVAGNKALREEMELVGLNAIQQGEVLRLRAQAVLLTKEQTLAELERNSLLTGTMTREQIALQQEIELLRERLALTSLKSAHEASAAAAEASLQEWQVGVDQVTQSLSDQLMAGGRGFGDYLKNLARTLLFKPIIQAIVQPVAGGVTSMLGLNAAQSSSNAMGLLSNGRSLLSGSSAIFSDFGGYLSNTMYEWGGKLFSMGADTIGNGAYKIADALAGAADTINVAGNVLGYGKALLDLTKGNYGGAIGTAVGTWFGGPVGAFIGSTLGNLVGGSIFGGKVSKRGEGIDGQLGGELRTYADYKKSGGWFGSNKYWTDYGAMEGNAQIQTTFAALQTSITQQAKVLGVSADAVATYTRKIRFSTEGLSGDQVAARLQEEMAAAGDEMAALVLGTAQYTKAGETATATLQRLTGSLGVVNTTLEVTRGKLFDVGLAGANMASDLVDRFGGLDAYISASEAYYQAYYTQAERANQSTDAMRKQLEALGLSLPQSREQFRQLVGSLDLTTASGREAYATLIKMAPQFDETATMLDELARAAAADLIATYTKAAAVAPGMKIAQDAMAAVVTQSDRFAGSVSTINKILGDSSSGVLVFGDRVQTVTSALDPAQLAVQRLRAEIMDMQASASGTVVDIDGLAKALEGVDVRSFSATVVGVFDLIANRIRSNLADIASEREAVREAAISIIAPRAMTPAQIREQIKAQTVALPNQNGIAAAQAALAKADTLVKKREAEWSAAVANNANRSPGLYNSAAQLEAQRGNAARSFVATYLRFGNVQDGVKGESVPGSLAGLAVYNDTQANMLAKMQNLPTSEIQAFADQLARLGSSGLRGDLGSTQTYLSYMEAYNKAVASEGANLAKAASLREQAAALATKATTAEQALAAARAQQSAATGNAQKAQLDYVAALQKYSMDSGKAVSNLSKLREETVAWYQSQAQLAQTMGDSASGLRQTVADVRFGMLDTPAQFANLQERFNVAYSMAMSTSGETLAGYGNELNSLLNPLLQKAQEAGLSSSEYSSLVQTMLARAEAVANRLDKEAPKNYQEESLGLLGQIDSTLAALEAGAKSTEQLMVEAIKAGTDTTRDGLRAVIAVLRGQAVPAFAEGGLHAGGLRLVGERGRELEVTGAARYYSAEQTARLLAGAQPPVVAQLVHSPGVDLRPLVDEVKQLRRDVTGLLQRVGGATEAVAVNTGRLQRNVDRITVEGMPVRNVENEHLAVLVEAADAADSAN